MGDASTIIRGRGAIIRAPVRPHAPIDARESERRYRVLLENGHSILAYAAGKMSKHKIRVLEGDRVSVVLSPYDLTRGRVIYRHK